MLTKLVHRPWAWLVRGAPARRRAAEPLPPESATQSAAHPNECPQPTLCTHGGDYRVLYTIDNGELVVWVVHVGHRSTVHDA
ncbi:type II toxin-antitoxin system RelE/ParE family toxin [Streptomyces sp. NBC_01232]|uniref:type II toxin-antitoxin system RelE family toxin n=1 Tax=Streptomyces sp. NBC_01232 TaxID=2903786 RepID=UPI002E14C191|nr:type II toxin-antitoxin system RelE/ParE family toxin [Streptomyces sp. NBC_01232]